MRKLGLSTNALVLIVSTPTEVNIGSTALVTVKLLLTSGVPLENTGSQTHNRLNTGC